MGGKCMEGGKREGMRPGKIRKTYVTLHNTLQRKCTEVRANNVRKQAV